MLMDAPHNTYAAHKGRCAFLLKLYTRAGENAPLARTLFRAERALPLTVPKANSRGVRRGKKWESRARGEYSGRGSAAGARLRRRKRALGLARHAAVLHRVALGLQIALCRFSHLRRIAEHAAAFAAEALIAGCSRGFHEIVVGICLCNLVDQARALVEEFLLATILLHALKDELHPVYGGVSFDASPLRQGDAGERYRHCGAKRDSVGRRHAPSLILKCNLHEARC